MLGGGIERSFSSDRADELTEKFRMLLASPLADGIARIVEESFRLIPIIPPPAAPAETSARYVAGPGRRDASKRSRTPAIDDRVIRAREWSGSTHLGHG